MYCKGNIIVHSAPVFTLVCTIHFYNIIDVCVLFEYISMTLIGSILVCDIRCGRSLPPTALYNINIHNLVKPRLLLLFYFYYNTCSLIYIKYSVTTVFCIYSALSLTCCYSWMQYIAYNVPILVTRITYIIIIIVLVIGCLFLQCIYYTEGGSWLIFVQRYGNLADIFLSS